jgi:hypothetical protein
MLTRHVSSSWGAPSSGLRSGEPSPSRKSAQVHKSRGNRWDAEHSHPFHVFLEGNPRPVDAVIGAQPAALARVPAWIASATGGCKSGFDLDQRFVRTCTPVRELERELGAARGYEAARARVTELRHKLTAMTIAETADPLAASAAAFAHFVGLSGGRMIAFLVVGACECMSWIGVTAVIILFRHATGPSTNGMLGEGETGIARDGPTVMPARRRLPAGDNQRIPPVRWDGPTPNVKPPIPFLAAG